MTDEDFGFSGDMNRLKASAEAGDADAQLRLGICYEVGQGVTRNRAQAFRWCRKAAEQGHAQAQNKLSECYYNGTGVERDEEQAAYWRHRAEELGDVQDRPSERCGESAPKGKRRGGEDEPLGLFRLILRIAMFVLCEAIPFVDPEIMNLTSVCQFMISYLYVYAVVIVVVLVRILDRISKWALSIMLLLYFLSWAASIAFGFLVLGGLPGFAMIFFPAIFWLLISYILNLKDKWEAGML